MADDKQSDLTPWSDVVGGIQTGDLLLSSGSGLEDTAIKDVTGGSFSHAGMLTRSSPSAAPRYWEEDLLGHAFDPHTHDTHGGAQLGDALTIAQKMIQNEMTVFYVRLVWDRPDGLDAEMNAILDDLDGHLPFMLGWHGDEMAFDYFEGHYLHRLWHPDRMFCSELVAATLQRLGLLSKHEPPNYYSPSSFTPELALELGARFTEPVELLVPPG